MEFEYIYALQNKSLGSHHIKIGMTKKTPTFRAKQLYTSGVPEPFNIAFACKVMDCEAAEKRIHTRLKTYRTNKSREFFRIPIDIAKKVIIAVCQEINEASNCFIENPVEVDIGEPDESNELVDESESVRWLKAPDGLRVSVHPPGFSSLSKEQIERIEIISQIFASVYPDKEKAWITDFTRDRNPEDEICIWENIAKAFLKVDQVNLLSEQQKKEAYALLLMRSMMSASEVLKNVKVPSLSKKAAKEVLRGYEAEPVPISVIIEE